MISVLIAVYLCLAVFLLPAFASTGSNAPSFPGGALVGIIIIVLCLNKRQKEIGGWLLYYYVQIYIGAFIGVIVTAISYENYLPASWAPAPDLYPLFLLSTLPSLLVTVVQLVVAEKLRKSREFAFVRILRYVLWVDLVVVISAFAIDINCFKESLIFDVIQLIWPLVWLPYFYFSKRVRRVFETKDWISVESHQVPV